MNTKKVESTKPVSNPETHATEHKTVATHTSEILLKPKKRFFNFAHLVTFLYSFVVLVVTFGCLFIHNGSLYGFYKINGSISGVGIFIIIFVITALGSLLTSILLNKYKPNTRTLSYLIKQEIFICIAIIYLLILGFCTGVNNNWLVTDTLTVGGANFILWFLIFLLYLGWAQIDHFYGKKIKAWWSNHKPGKKK